MGGEKYTKSRKPLYLQGSPPRGRGKVEEPEMIDMSMGITPAWAGKRFTHTPSGSAYQDHPRVGGEKK